MTTHSSILAWRIPWTEELSNSQAWEKDICKVTEGKISRGQWETSNAWRMSTAKERKPKIKEAEETTLFTYSFWHEITEMIEKWYYLKSYTAFWFHWLKNKYRMSCWWWMIQFNDPGYNQMPSVFRGFLHISIGKESVSNAGDPGLIPGLGRSAGEGIGYPFQYTWASLVAQLGKNLPAMRDTWVWSLGWKDPLEKGKATHSSILAWRIPWTV